MCLTALTAYPRRRSEMSTGYTFPQRGKEVVGGDFSLAKNTTACPLIRTQGGETISQGG